MKRMVLGTLLLLAVVTIGMTVELPFSLLVAVTVGLLPPDGFIFPRGPFRLVWGLSLILVALVGILWLGWENGPVERALNALNDRLVASKKTLLRSFVRFVVGIPLFGIICLPPAAFWWVVGALVYKTPIDRWLNGPGWVLLFPTGFIWIAVLVGRPHTHLPRIPVIGKLVIRAQAVFFQWVMFGAPVPTPKA